MRMLFALGALVLTGCVETPKTAEGCPIYATPMMQAQTQTCQQAFYEAKARASGGTVTRCFGGATGMTCVSE